MKATHQAKVVRVKLSPHPNADKLAVCQVSDWILVVGKDDFKDGDLAVHVVPDSVVSPSLREKYPWIRPDGRVKVQKFRGLFSQGLLLPAPEGMKEGEDAAELLGISRYEPPILNAGTSGKYACPPGFSAPFYDVDAIEAWPGVLREGEQVIVTEKIHGANARFCWDGGLHVATRRHWLEDGQNIWWEATRQNSEFVAMVERLLHTVVYAEVYGSVQDLRYGAAKGKYKIAVFDAYKGGRWFTYDALLSIFDPFVVPLLWDGAYSKQLHTLSRGESQIAGAKNIREGCVIRSASDRYEMLDLPLNGRVQFKCVNPDYLSR